MSITGKPGQCVNVKKNKHSYVSLTSDASEITNTTDVDKKTPINDGKGREWTGTVVRRIVPDKVRIRLTADKEVKGKEVEPPDGGTVTVTLVNPTATVPVEVVYVEDNHP